MTARNKFLLVKNGCSKTNLAWPDQLHTSHLYITASAYNWNLWKLISGWRVIGLAMQDNLKHATPNCE